MANVVPHLGQGEVEHFVHFGVDGIGGRQNLLDSADYGVWVGETAPVPTRVDCGGDRGSWQQ
jgi:hypothetical protein